MEFAKDFIYRKKFSTKELLILNDSSPLDDCGNRFNWIYVVAACASVIFAVLIIAGGENIFLGLLVFLFIIWGSAWGIKMKLCSPLYTSFREAKFAINAKYPLPELMTKISPTLEKEGLSLSLDNEAIIISSKRTKYEVSYLQDQLGFQVYWYKTLIRAFLSFDNIILYREISETTALIAYVIQCVTGTNDYNKTNNTVSSISNNTYSAEPFYTSFIECPNCHKNNPINSKFCKYCGTKI